MAKRRGRRPTKKPNNNEVDGDEDNKEVFDDSEVERQSAAIRALRDVEIDQLWTMARFLKSEFSEEQLQAPVLQFFKESLPNLSIVETGQNGEYEVTWKDKDGCLSLNQGDETKVHESFLHQLSMAYPDFSAGFPPFGGFEFSNQSVKTVVFGADKLQIRPFDLDEPSGSKVLEPKDGLQTPSAYNNSRLSYGMTPKTLRLPKYGEMLLSVNGSPLGVYKEDNMETIQETEDG